MLFTYKAKTKSGEVYEKRTQASDKLSLIEEIRAKGDVPVSISEVQESFLKKFSDKFESFFAKVRVKDQMIFTKNLSAMISAGLSLKRSLSILKKQTNNKKFKAIIDDLVENIESGGSLSSGLAKFPKTFSALFISMTKAGEESGSLAKALDEIAVHLERQHTLTKKIKGAMTYPAIILSAIFAIAILMMVYVVPTITSTFKEMGVDVPASTQFIISVSDFLANSFFLFLAVLLALILALVYFFRSTTGQRFIDYALLHLPAISTMDRQINSARFCRTLSSLLASGVDMTKALSITKDVLQNSFYKQAIAEAEQDIQKGVTLSAVLKDHPKLFPVMVTEMVEVGEETGKLSEMLYQGAIFYEAEVESRTDNLSTIIEPVIMIVIGIAVGFFAVSMITPMYSLVDGI